jgi:putative salt-induced outer membrane protein YdiY
MLPTLVFVPLLLPSDTAPAWSVSPAVSALQDAPAAAAPAEEPPKVYPDWTGTITAGLTFTKGNSESQTINGQADIKRETEQDRWTGSAWYNNSEQDVEDDPLTAADESDTLETVDNLGAKLQYDYFITKKLYAYLNTKYEQDDAADLDSRYTVGTGLGYQFYDTETFDLNAEGGLSWVREELEGEDANEFLAARAATNWEYLWTETTKLGQTAEVYPSLEDSDDWTSKIDTHADISVTKAMFVRIQHVLDYDNSPAQFKQPADNRVIVSVGWSF